MAAMKLTPSDLFSMVLLIIILGGTGVGLFVWMAATGWKDLPGVVVGVIFMVVTVIQIVISIAFWRISRSGKFTPTTNGIEADSIEIKALQSGNDTPKKAV